ncbi:hypothetical protein Dimus_024789 [Dionaea muscipula]
MLDGFFQFCRFVGCCEQEGFSHPLTLACVSVTLQVTWRPLFALLLVSFSSVDREFHVHVRVDEWKECDWRGQEDPSFQGLRDNFREGEVNTRGVSSIFTDFFLYFVD